MQIRVASRPTCSSATDARRVDVVSHSMGAISSRYYVERLDGADRVDAWVSLAGVNRGHDLGVRLRVPHVVPRDGARIPGAREAGAGVPPRRRRPVRHVVVAVRSDDHPAGVPPRSPAPRNTETACIGHSALKTDPTVFGQVLRFVAAPHRSG